MSKVRDSLRDGAKYALRAASVAMMIAAGMTATHAAAQAAVAPSELAAVYAVRRVASASTCASVRPGDVSSTLWMIGWTAGDGLTVEVVGATTFRQLSITARGAVVTLSGQAGSSSTTVQLTRQGDSSLSGTETTSAVDRNVACTVTRAVTASSFHPAAVAQTPPSTTLVPSPPTSTFDTNTIAVTIRGRSAAIQRCYENELSRDRSLRGRVLVQFNVEPAGNISGAAIVSNETGNTQLGLCVLDVVSRVRVNPGPSTTVPFSYPFQFAPSN